jgi:large subunit ribosomal protein L30
MARTFVWHRTRGPKHTPKEEAPTGGRLRIKQVRSGIGHPARLRATLKALGLNHHQAEVIQQDSATLRGMIRRVRHLITVTRVEE